MLPHLRMVARRASGFRRPLSAWPPPSRPPSGQHPKDSLGPVRFEASFSSRSTSDPRYFRLAMAVVGTGTGVYYLVHRDKAPVTGRARMIDMSRQREHALGEAAFRELLGDGRGVVSPRHPDSARVQLIGQRIARAAVDMYPELCQDFQWRFVLLNAPGDVNAVCCPGGKIAVFSGLLEAAPDEDALAAVLAHEVSHALARHSAERISFSKVLFAFQMLLNAVIDFAGISVMVTQLLLNLPYSRKLELEADHIGLELMARACFNPRASPIMFQRLDEMHRGSKKDSVAVSLVSTHPVFSERIAKLNALMPGAEAAYLKKCRRLHYSGMKDVPFDAL